MVLSKYYEDKNSLTTKFLEQIRRKFSKKEEENLHELLRDKVEDFEIDNGVFKEKRGEMRQSVVHCRKIQRSKYIKFDDNILNLKSMQNSKHRYETTHTDK